MRAFFRDSRFSTLEMLSPSARNRKRGRDPDGTPTGDGCEGLDLRQEDLDQLREYLKKEETRMRSTAPGLLNKDVVERIEAFKKLYRDLQPYNDFNSILKQGLVDCVRQELTACFKLGMQLETWLNTFIPPLSAGGNVGVSAEVQDGIFSHVHQLTTGASDAIHHMLALEKELAQMQTKCKDEEVWERYRAVIDVNMVHCINKAVLDMQAQLMLIGGAILNNFSHLRKGDEDSKINALY